MIGESKKERKPVIFQNVQFSPKCSSQSVNPCLQSWTQWTNFFVEFRWKISHVHDLRGECTFLLYSSSSILPVKNLFHKLYRFWECPFCSPLYLSAFLVLALWSLRPRWVLGTLKSPSLGLSCSHQMDAAGLTTHSHLLPLTSPTTRYNNIPMPTT